MFLVEAISATDGARSLCEMRTRPNIHIKWHFSGRCLEVRPRVRICSSFRGPFPSRPACDAFEHQPHACSAGCRINGSLGLMRHCERAAAHTCFGRPSANDVYNKFRSPNHACVEHQRPSFQHRMSQSYTMLCW